MTEVHSVEVLHALIVSLRKEVSNMTKPITTPRGAGEPARDTSDPDNGFWVAIPEKIIRVVEEAEAKFGFDSRIAELAHVQLSIFVLTRLAEVKS